MSTDLSARKRRLHYRAWHRGTKEADVLIGSFVSSRLETLTVDDIVWLEQFLEQNDVHIMAWITGHQAVPDAFSGPLMDALKAMDYMTL